MFSSAKDIYNYSLYSLSTALAIFQVNQILKIVSVHLTVLVYIIYIYIYIYRENDINNFQSATNSLTDTAKISKQ